MALAHTVLVVDDEMLIRWSLGEALCDAGFDVREARDGREAITAFAAGVDAVILDLRLPDVDGITLLARFKAAAPHVPVVLMSAHAGVDAEARARRLGVEAIMRKPFPLEAMVAQVTALFPPPPVPASITAPETAKIMG